MANQLLDSSALDRESAHPTHQENVMPKEEVVKDERQCLYRGLDSQIFDGPAAVEAALEDGWHEHPDDARAEMPDEHTDTDENLRESLKIYSNRVDELESGIANLTDQLGLAKEAATENEGLAKGLNDENRALKAEVAKLKKAAKK